MTTPSFWKGKRVFLTGHTGFKGSWTALMLSSWGARVCGYSLEAPSEPNLFSAAKVQDGIEHHTGDVRDLENLQKKMHDFAPDIVLHLAAQALVRASYTDPLGTFSTNMMGTANVLECIRKLKSVRSVVIVTTDKCYENKEWLWPYRENEPLGGKDPYSSSKAGAELVTASYRSSFFETQNPRQTFIASARAGNVIGGGDWAADRLIPDLVRTFVKGEKTLIRSPYAIRPWQHVLEPISGYLLLAEKLFESGVSFEGAWNFGPRDEDAREVSYVVEQMCKYWGPDAKWQLDANPHPHEASLLKLDISKAHRQLKWSPRWNIDQALELTTQWYKAYYQNPSGARGLCLEQIQMYMRKG